MARPRAHDSVELRKPSELFPEDSNWKVTARYDLQVAATKSIRCVRVRYFGSGAPFVGHFTEAEFARVFKPRKRVRS